MSEPDTSAPPAPAREPRPAFARDDPDTARRRRELGRMRAVATYLLVLMSFVFVATSFGMKSWPWLAYVRAFAEAAMVGACADWFAVVALFRQPFGLPIPHTGIVPRNKEKIGGALGRFISNNFLSPAILAGRLNRIDAGQYAADWLTRPGNAARVAEQAKAFIPRVLELLPQDKLVDWLSRASLRGIGAIPAAPVASKALALVWARGETQALLNRALDWAEESLPRNKDVIRDKVSEKTARLLPKWIDALLADRIMSGIQSTLAEMRKPDHPWRLEIKRTIEKLVADLAQDPAMRARGEAMKNDLLANPVFEAQVREVCETLWRQVDANVSERSDSLASALEFGLLAVGRWLQSDARARERLNHWVRRLALRALTPRRAEIGAYIADVVAKWDATTLVNRLELQVGRDLQYIRINGTIVGGLVGLLIFAASNWIAGL